MSLIHWWPLNGNLNDIGIKTSLLVMNNVPSTQYINGKIGQCYNFDGSAWGQVSNVSVGTDCTICCWAKTSTTSSSMLWGMQCTGSDYMNLYNSWRICLNVGDSEDNPFKDSSDNDIPQIHDDVWHHFIVVFKGSEKAKLYIDGVYRGQAVTYRNPTMNNQNFTIGTWNYSSHGYYWTGGINDVRIYDHALSTKEVKEISKGLVLHYNFEDPYAEGTTNLITQAITDGGWYWSGSATITNEIVNVDNPALPFKQCRKTTYNISESVGGTYDTLQGHVPVQGSTVYAYSVYVKTNLPFSPNILYRYEYDSNNGYITEQGIASESSREDLGNGWYRYFGTFTTQSNTANITFQTFNYPSQTGELYRYVGGAQVERKDHATPYVLGTRANGLIYDNSGYGYNGTQHGSLQILEDSASGKYSIFSPPNANYVERQNIPLDCLNATQEFTITCWLKVLSYHPSDTWNTIFRLAAGDGTDLQLHMCYDYRGKIILSQYADDPEFDSHIEINKWVHLTWVHYKDGSAIKCKYYVNGSLIGTGTYNGALNIQANPRLTLFYDSIRSYYGSSSYLGDFKIYATALSAEDILLEYNRKASIDKNGNVFTGEFIENYDNIAELANYAIEKQLPFTGYLAASTAKKTTYDSNWPNPTESGLGTYQQGNLLVTLTSDGVRIYSEPNRDGRAQEGSEWNTWGGLCYSPMMNSRCLIKDHRYVISWHVKGQSSRAMSDVYWTNQVGWGQYPDASPTVHKAVLQPENFQGEMDCMYDFTIEDDIWKTTTDDVHSGFEPNTTYLAYAAFKMGYTYGFTGELGTDIYITNLQMIDVTDGRTYKITKNGIIETTQIVSGINNKARIHSSGMLDVTSIKEV